MKGTLRYFKDGKLLTSVREIAEALLGDGEIIFTDMDKLSLWVITATTIVGIYGKEWAYYMALVPIENIGGIYN